VSWERGHLLRRSWSEQDQGRVRRRRNRRSAKRWIEQVYGDTDVIVKQEKVRKEAHYWVW
jgi:hypothetical protein